MGLIYKEGTRQVMNVGENPPLVPDKALSLVLEYGGHQ